MAWEDQEQHASLGGTKRPSMVSPDESAALGSGSSADDKLFRLLTLAESETPKLQMMSFNAIIDDMLDSFVDRHEKDMTDSAANDFKTTLRRVKRSAEVLRETGYETQPKLLGTVVKLYEKLRNEVFR